MRLLAARPAVVQVPNSLAAEVVRTRAQRIRCRLRFPHSRRCPRSQTGNERGTAQIGSASKAREETPTTVSVWTGRTTPTLHLLRPRASSQVGCGHVVQGEDFSPAPAPKPWPQRAASRPLAALPSGRASVAAAAAAAPGASGEDTERTKGAEGVVPLWLRGCQHLHDPCSPVPPRAGEWEKW